MITAQPIRSISDADMIMPHAHSMAMNPSVGKGTDMESIVIIPIKGQGATGFAEAVASLNRLFIMSMMDAPAEAIEAELVKLRGIEC